MPIFLDSRQEMLEEIQMQFARIQTYFTMKCVVCGFVNELVMYKTMCDVRSTPLSYTQNESFVFPIPRLLD